MCVKHDKLRFTFHVSRFTFHVSRQALYHPCSGASIIYMIFILNIDQKDWTCYNFARL